MTQPIDKTALSYWFPMLETAGIPVPKTILIDMPSKAMECIWASFDGENKNAFEFNQFVKQIVTAANEVGYPAFLRTEHTSAKHEWDETCFIPHKGIIAEHISAICYFSEMVGIMGLSYSRWAVREYLPIIPYGTCPKFSNMPLCREFRFFVNNGVIECFHPYWPRKALVQGGADANLFEKLSALTTSEREKIHQLAERAGKAVPGHWSIDILETERGWYVTDMAEAHKSFHFEGCGFAGEQQ